jgi:hypothetical protein
MTGSADGLVEEPVEFGTHNQAIRAEDDDERRHEITDEMILIRSESNLWVARRGRSGNNVRTEVETRKPDILLVLPE